MARARTHLLFKDGRITEVDVSSPKPGDLRLWWIPQVPMKQFHVYVADVEQAMLLYDTLAQYDLFQLDNNIKPDFCNAGGLEVWEDGEWCEWWSEGTCEDIREYTERIREESKAKAK